MLEVCCDAAKEAYDAVASEAATAQEEEVDYNHVAVDTDDALVALAAFGSAWRGPIAVEVAETEAASYS
jgi:hypothetical protein